MRQQYLLRTRFCLSNSHLLIPSHLHWSKGLQAASVASVLLPQIRHEFLTVSLLVRLAYPAGITLIAFFLSGFEKNSAAASEPALHSLPVGRGTKGRENFWHTLIPSPSLQPTFFGHSVPQLH